VHIDLQGRVEILLAEKGPFFDARGVASPDGRYLAYPGRSFTGDVWLLENF